MVARLLAYNVAEVLQADTKIEGENSEELFTQSIKVISANPRFRTTRVELRANGVTEFKWVNKSVWIPWLEKKEQRVSK